MKRLRDRSKLALLVLLGLALGWGVRSACQPAAPLVVTVEEARRDGDPAPSTIWTCSMHPQIQLPEPGACPICSMDLVPVESGQSGRSEDLRRVTITPEARALMQLRTAPVERRFVEKTVRMVGKIEYDETRLAYITAWVPGRLDRLYVDYTGVTVQRGDHVAELYSPQLYSAQSELLQAARAAQRLDDGASDPLGGTTRATREAAAERLRQWGLSSEQIDEILERGTPSDRVTMRAPIGGVVVQKDAQQGMYVEQGTRIYTIADLSQLWVMLDAYESDLVWLHYGQPVEFTTEALPGRAFHGTVAFIDPVLDDTTRTVKVRVNVSNPDGLLKPGMFVRATVRTRVAAGGGSVIGPELAGKWICPMHPEVLAERAGDCPLCGMDLVTTDSLGYVPLQEERAPLVVPASAPLWTGTRSVVYVEVPGSEVPTYEGREIVLGPRAGESYVVHEGLRAGERVVVHGAFKLDSSLQIQARPSMMAPVGGPAGQPGGSHAHDHD